MTHVHDDEPLFEKMSSDLPRPIAPGVTWMSSCLEFHLPTRVIHGHTSTYLVQGPDASVLIDTGNPSSWAAISDTLDELLGDRPLTYVMPTHPELPHTGNLPRLVEKYPDIVAIGDIRDYHLFYPQVVPNLRAGKPGDRIELGGGQAVVLVEAMIRDLPNTLWAFATEGGVLFTADGFCYMHRPELDDEDPYHLPGECGLLTSELDSPPTVENAAMFTGSALYWARWVDDADTLYAGVSEAMEALGTRIVAPTHGNVIDDVAGVLPIIRTGHQSAYRG